MIVPNIDYDKFEKFFSQSYCFLKHNSIEQYIYENVGMDLVEDHDRAKALLKTCFLQSKSSMGISYKNGHPSRIFITRLMRIMKSMPDIKNSLLWMNKMQDNEAYRSSLQRCCRYSNAQPKSKWRTESLKVWDNEVIKGVNGKGWTPKNYSIIVPDKDTSRMYSSLDINAFKNKNHISLSRNKYGLPPFVLALDLDLFNSIVLSN